jgi:integrase
MPTHTSTWSRRSLRSAPNCVKQERGDFIRSGDDVAKRANGEGSLYQRSDGWWVAQVDLGWQNGKRKRKYVTARTRADAHAKLRKVLTERDHGTVITARPMKVSEWFETYRRDVAPSRQRVSTLELLDDLMRRHINPGIGHHRLDALKPHHLVALYNEKLAAGLSPSSVRQIHSVVRRALSVAVKWQLLHQNVATLVDPPKVTRVEVEPLTSEEAQQLLRALPGNRLEARWIVGLALGLRQGEVLGLWWDDVDLEAGTLRVRRALQRQRVNGLVFIEPKTSRSRRTVSLPEPLVDALRAHRSRQLQERLAAGSMWKGSECVFTTECGAPIDPRNDYRAFKMLLGVAGLRDVRLHDLRHTAASLLLLQGVAPRVVMEVLGHSQISLTMNTYSHVVPELKRDAAERMGTALWGV